MAFYNFEPKLKVVKIVCKGIQHKIIVRYYYSKLQFLPHHLEVFQ